MVPSVPANKDAGKLPPRKTPSTKLPEAVAFGARVRELRQAKGWSQERLAEAANVNAVQISHIENGEDEPKLTTILRLARALRVRPGDLLD